MVNLLSLWLYMKFDYSVCIVVVRDLSTSRPVLFRAHSALALAKMNKVVCASKSLMWAAVAIAMYKLLIKEQEVIRR